MTHARARGLRTVYLLALATVVAWPGQLPASDTWQLLNPLPTEHDLHGVGWGNGLYVAVGAEGTVLTSELAAGWKVVEVATTADLYGVVWTGPRFMAVGAGGVVLTSLDGATWAVHTTGADAVLRDVAASAELVVAVGERGLALTSADGEAWTEQDTGTDAELFTVVWADTVFVAAGQGGVVLSSPDGTTWSSHTPYTDEDILDLAYQTGGYLLLAGERSGYGRVNGDWVWVHPLSPGVEPGASRAAAACPPPRGVVTVGADGRHWYRGVEWVRTASAEQRLTFNDAVCGPDGFVAVGVGGHIGSSRDGVHWRLQNAVTDYDLSGVVVGDAGAVAVGGFGSWQGAAQGALLRSRDGLTWTTVERTYGTITDVAHGDGVYVAVGYYIACSWATCSTQSATYTSLDGVSWDRVYSATDGLRSITWHGDRFVALADSAVAISTDGHEWQATAHGSESAVIGIAANPDLLVIVGYDGLLMTSSDGAQWSTLDPVVDADLHQAAWGAGTFVAVGAGGTVLTSHDGAQWTLRDSGSNVNLNDVEWTGERFLVSGADGAVLSSSDGLAWQRHGPVASGNLLGIAEVDGRWLVVGANGLMARAARAEPGDPPHAAFTWRPTPVEAGMPVHFVDRSVGEATSWQWSFGDGVTSSEVNPVHIFATLGTYTVELTAGNLHGEDAEHATVAVTARCGPPEPPVVSAPPMVGHRERFEITWSPSHHYQYHVQEAVDQDFRYLTWDRATTPGATRLERWASWFRSPFYYRVAAVGRCPDGDWFGEWSAPVRIDVVPTVAIPGEYASVIPAAAHTVGLDGRRWSTDMMVHNPGSGTTRVALLLLDGAAVLGGFHELALAANTSVLIEDVVPLLTDAGDATGGIVVGSDRPLVVGSRTWTDGPGGTVGQYVAGMLRPRGLSHTDPRQVVQLRSDSGTRTNLGLTNPRAPEREALVELIDGDGTLLASTTVAVPPYGHVQLNRIDVGSADLAWATVTEPDLHGRLVSYSSVVDAGSGDAVAQVADRPGASWTRAKAPSPDRESIAVGAGAYVLYGGNRLYASADGRGWEVTTLGSTNASIEAMASNGIQLVGVGELVIVTSSDGLTWREIPSPHASYTSLAWNGSMWLAVGADGAAMTSSDGLEWRSFSAFNETLDQLVWAGRFVATLAGGRVATSPDGLCWSVHDVGMGFHDLATDGTTIVGVSNSGGLHWSGDGVEWTRAEVSGNGPGRVVWAGDRFLGVAISSNRTSISVSLSGRSWEAADFREPDRSWGGNWLEDLAWDGSKLVGVVQFGHSLAWLVPNDNRLLLPGAAHAPGRNGAAWRSDVDLVASGTETIECQIELLAADTDNTTSWSTTVAVPPRSARRFADVVADLGAEGVAAVRVTPSGEDLRAAGRTFDDRASGAVAQHLPARHGEDAIWHFTEGRLIGMRHAADPSTGFRTNLGLVSACAEPMVVDVALFRGNGDLLGQLSLELAPYGVTQRNDILRAFTGDDIECGFAILTTDNRRCSFHAYASVIDNRSGDPMLIPAVTSSSVGVGW